MIWIFLTAIVGMIFFFVRHYFFRDKHGIPLANDQHEELTRRAVAYFVEQTGIKAPYKVRWVDTVDEAGKTVIFFSMTGDEPSKFAGLTLNGYDCYVAWRGSIRESALFHELGHAAMWKSKGMNDPAHKDTEWWQRMQDMRGTFDE